MLRRWSSSADLDAEFDDVLSLLPLAEIMPSVADRTFSRLTDCLVEAVLHDIWVRHRDGQLDRAGYLTELCGVVVELQERGLLGRDATPERH